MKNRIQIRFARIIVWVVSFLIAQAIVSYMTPVIFGESIRSMTTSQPLWVGLTIISIILIFGTVGVFLLLYSFAHVRGYVEKVDSFLTEYQKKRKEKWIAKRIALGKEFTRKKAELRELYTLDGFYPHDTPFTFRISFKEKIVREALPIVRINNQLASISLFSEKEMLCHLDKSLTARTAFFNLQVGDSSIQVENPYRMMESEEPIRWQCEGHLDEKVILIPISYFPHTFWKAIYEFNLRIGDTTFKNFRGECVLEGFIVVQLRKDEPKKAQCVGKKVILELNMEGAPKITLPEPEVLWVNGQPV